MPSDLPVEEVISIIGEEAPGALLASGFDEAILGIGSGGGSSEPIVVYDYDECVEVLIRRDGMTREDAIEHMDYNVTGGFVGERTPFFMRRIESLKIPDA